MYNENLINENGLVRQEEKSIDVNSILLDKIKLIRKRTLPYVMIAPSMILFALFMIYPIIYMVYLSFYKWNLLSEKEFIGFKNYVNMFQNPEFFQVLLTTVKFMVGTVSGSIILALLLALYLKSNTKMNRFLQSIIFTPYIVSLVSIAFIFMWMMDSDLGLFNYILGLLHIPKVRWLDNPQVAIYSLVLVNIWKGIGYYTIIFISALQSIPTYLYEAAKLDKTSKLKTFFRITLPMISPTLFFVTLTGIISGLKVFETIKIMTGGANATNTLVYNIYQYGFSFYKIGYASALGVVLMIVIGLMTLLYFKVLSKKVYYS
ncbi:carbohydrate ABC transporter permease [Anaerocolumna sp. MB42-C2]|uniref:carbohydrate ABC transporter permease n=1 Tax=Anaerocolumna sp. MB42-C2 TaxID=3070997 RepID=UPI0027E082EC|nr:sugar ABC transporter permease [Anaerocolumna sp. MB42-C2]WMJ87282.1 sugar ABC transporter permease [Anaerocolumna sp. MB42-C2]